MDGNLFNLIVDFDDNTTKTLCFRGKKNAENFKQKIEDNKHTDTHVTVKNPYGKSEIINPKRVVALSIEEVDTTAAE